MVYKYLPDRRGIGDASFDAVLDDVVAQAAAAIKDKAHELALEAKDQTFADSLKIDTGQRPKGRGYRRVLADDPNGEKKEWGDTDTARLRILGQAANIQVFPDV